MQSFNQRQQHCQYKKNKNAIHTLHKQIFNVLGLLMLVSLSECQSVPLFIRDHISVSGQAQKVWILWLIKSADSPPCFATSVTSILSAVVCWRGFVLKTELRFERLPFWLYFAAALLLPGTMWFGGVFRLFVTCSTLSSGTLTKWIVLSFFLKFSRRRTNTLLLSSIKPVCIVSIPSSRFLHNIFSSPDI